LKPSKISAGRPAQRKAQGSTAHHITPLILLQQHKCMLLHAANVLK
jgi:hypothetical protein